MVMKKLLTDSQFVTTKVAAMAMPPTIVPTGLVIMATVKARKPAITAGKTLEAKAMNEVPRA